MVKKVFLGESYQLVCSLGGLLRCEGVMGQIWRSTCTSRGHRLLTYQEVKVERLIAPLLVWALGQWRCGGKKKGDIWTGKGEQRKLQKKKETQSPCFKKKQNKSKPFKTVELTEPSARSFLLHWVSSNETQQSVQLTYRSVWCVCWPARAGTSAGNTKRSQDVTCYIIHISTGINEQLISNTWYHLQHRTIFSSLIHCAQRGSTKKTTCNTLHVLIILLFATCEQMIATWNDETLPVSLS